MARKLSGYIIAGQLLLFCVIIRYVLYFAKRFIHPLFENAGAFPISKQTSNSGPPIEGVGKIYGFFQKKKYPEDLRIKKEGSRIF